MLTDTTLDLLKFSAFPDLAGALEACATAIMNRWQAMVLEKLPAADHLTVEQLRDELPAQLRELAKTLASSDGSHLGTLEHFGEGHGQLRFHQSFNVNELLIEYGLLRPIVIDEVVTHLNRPLTPAESAAMNMGLDFAVRKAVTQFTTHQQQQSKVSAEAQSKYLSFLSHDLRGGLNGVLLMIEVLKRDLMGEAKFAESVQDLDSMRQSILGTVGTMDRFLQAERFRQGKVKPRNTTVELEPLLNGLITQLSYQAKSKGLNLQAAVPQGTSIQTDPELLLLVLQNILSNAIKYTSKGNISVTVETEPKPMTRILITDQGPGIAQDRLAKLFDPFTRGETHGQGGVGLGLSIARQAADLLGAKLTVQSTVGVGSTFVLELR